MSIQTRTVDYRDGDTELQGFLAWNEEAADTRPGVLVDHTWAGRTEAEEAQAVRLAELGYVGFAIDMYGKGVRGSNREECSSLMQPLVDNRQLIQQRMKLALEQLKRQKEVDEHKTAAAGYCFGGLCVLDLARSGAEFRGAASFHGLLSPPEGLKSKKIKSRVLVMHGWDDPLAPPGQLVDFANEMTEAGVDWQVHAYGQTAHAFTNRAANDPDFGTVYSELADQRSWQTFQLFLAEIFKDPMI